MNGLECSILGGKFGIYQARLEVRYCQVRIAEEDVAKTTCVTMYGSFEFQK